MPSRLCSLTLRPLLLAVPFCHGSTHAYLCHPVYAPLLCPTFSCRPLSPPALHLPFHADPLSNTGRKSGQLPLQKKEPSARPKAPSILFQNSFLRQDPAENFFDNPPQKLYALPHIGAKGNTKCFSAPFAACAAPYICAFALIRAVARDISSKPRAKPL